MWARLKTDSNRIGNIFWFITVSWSSQISWRSMTKEHFVSVSKIAVNEFAKSKTIQNEFPATALWNGEIDYSKCFGG